MCGRYQFTADQCAEILQIVQEVERRCGPNAWNPGEIRPTAMAPVLVASSAGIQPELYAWGYKLPKSLVINARAESAMEKPLFRDSMRSKRCVIPSTGFFEWSQEKRKYFFKLPEEDALYMADLASCDSLENGVIMLYNKIISKVRAAQDILISEEEIDAILSGQSIQGLQDVVPVVERCAQQFVSDLLSALRERQLELRTAPVVFVGGGSILLKRHIESSGKVAHPIFVEDIRANAKGYEALYRLSHNSR